MAARGANQLDRPGLSARERAEAKAELVLAGRKQWWQKLMSQGKDVRAGEYAATYNFTDWAEEQLIAVKKFDAVIAAHAEPVVEKPRAEIAEIAPVPAPVGELVDGWPVKVTAEVYRYPVNKRMVVVQLDDGRQARLWNKKNGRRWTLGSKVKIKLVETNGEEAIYDGDFGDE